MSNFFSVPDKEKSYQGYMVYVLTIIWASTTALVVATTYFIFPELWFRYLVLLFSSMFILVFNLALNHLLSPRIASWSLPITCWLMVTISCYTAGGIESPHILTQMIVVLTAGFLLGWKGGLVFGLVSVGVDFVYAYMAVSGTLPAPFVAHTPISRWIGALIPFGTILVLQYYATNLLRIGLSAMQREMVKRTEAEKIKDQTLFTLKERIKELTTLYSVSRILQNEDTHYQNILNEIVTTLPNGWQYPAITAARVSIAETETSTHNYQPSDYSQRAEMTTDSGTKVVVEVVYLHDMPTCDEGPFLEEERHLINMLVEMLKNDLERRERNVELKDYQYALDIASLVSISDVNGTFLFVNEHFCKASKYTPEELLGKDHSMLWSGIHTPEYFKGLATAMQSGIPFRGEFCNKAKDGTLYWLDSSIVPFLDDKGKVYQYLSINHDITRQKQAEAVLRESEEKFRSIVEHSLVGIYIVQNDKLVYVNPGFEKIFGYSKAQLINKVSFEEIVHGDDIEMVREYSRKNSDHHRAKQQYIFKAIRNGGSILHVEVIASTIMYNGELAVIGTLVDNTARIEEERRINQVVLDTQEKERLQIGMELHDNVQQILVGSRLCLSIARKKLEDREAAVASMLNDVTQYNSEAIEELRRLSHHLAPLVESGTPLEERIMGLLRSLRMDERLSVSVFVDEFENTLDNSTQLAFYRILQEQLGNIVKHAEASSVEVHVRKAGHKILLQIKDDGKGFDNKQRREGIGLENIRRRAQLMGGKVEIISSPGEGCEVNILVPSISG